MSISTRIAVCLGFILAGCAREGSTPGSADRAEQSESELAFDAKRDNLPFVFIWLTPKYPLPDEELVAGLIVAVWQDGRIVRMRSEAEVGKAYVQGHLRASQFRELVRCVEESGILSTEPEERVALHAASDHLTIRTKGQVRTWAHSVPYTENAMVTRLKTFLLELELVDASPIEWKKDYPQDWDEQE